MSEWNTTELAENGEKLEQARQTEARIREEFEQGADDLHPCDQHYFERGLNEVLEMDGTMQHAWLDGVEAARVSYAENRDTELESMRHLLRDWLAPTNANPNGELGT